MESSIWTPGRSIARTSRKASRSFWPEPRSRVRARRHPSRECRHFLYPLPEPAVVPQRKRQQVHEAKRMVLAARVAFRKLAHIAVVEEAAFRGLRCVNFLLQG